MHCRNMRTYMNRWDMGWDVYDWNMWSYMNCRYVRPDMNWGIMRSNVNGWSVGSYINCMWKWMPPEPLALDFL